MKKYITYEEPLQNRIFTSRQMHEVYRDIVDKTEYPDFECWFSDMLRAGIFMEYDGKANENNEYISSAENGDYSPSHPWDAPGMSICDFI